MGRFTVTLSEIGLIDQVYQGDYQVIDRDTAETMEERYDLMRKSLLCDTYLTSFNAMSEDGVLVNVDSVGNRVAAIIDMNKVCHTVEDAVSRARNIAEPINSQRCSSSPFLHPPTKTPGVKNSSCGDCKSDGCICSYIVQTRMCKQEGRIKVILVGESLGF